MTDKLDYSLAPDALTTAEVETAIYPSIDCAAGLGMRLASMPSDSGWDQSTFWDHDAADHIAAAARSEARGYAKANAKWYNGERLDTYVGRLLIEAYSAGFLEMQKMGRQSLLVDEIMETASVG